ncbi:YaiO family outer membrane beta-barrel protein [Solimonas sp. K1W22B-7]|uniref:YaiO family outer membrane beta-barrel protein n=1 Tax=Solimonas sp. K1W22B-7 TaxID=2303331 RepID=UPI000E3323EB|nr:YaiO family outer membrane beta-barrel protein [Solimonas sp. K1W22B-7]AXQ29983.1 YaiO family outer membrane beta-barrel protein [Solimonas sp. K1W22B-7]
MKRYRLLLLACLFAPLAQAASMEEGLRLKQQEKFAESAAVFAGLVRENPRDLKALEQLATVEGWLQRYAESIAHWRMAIALAPQRADLRVSLARVLYWKGEHDAALAALDAALAAEPGNADAAVLRGDVLMAQGRPEAAREAYLKARQLPGADAAALETRLQRTQPPPRWRLDAGAAFDDYSELRGSEHSSFLQLGYRFSPSLTAYVHYDQFDWFDTDDQTLSAGAYWLPHPQWLLQVEAGSTSDADFRPKTQYNLQVEWLLKGPVQPLLGYRWYEYDNGRVATITPGLRWLPAPFSLELRHALSKNVDGSDTGVTSLRAAWEGSERWTPYLLYATGKEALPPQPKADFDVYAAGLLCNVTPAFGLRLDYAYEDRPDFYERNTVALAASWKF